VNTQPPLATGIRISWSEMPRRVHAALERRLGAPVTQVAMQPGGFSPGVAARVQLADGRRVFVKAVGPELNPDAPDIHRQEARIMSALPATAPAPRLLWTHDEGRAGWVILVFEDIDGWSQEQPWRSDELNRVMDALGQLAATLSPSPIDAISASDVFATRIRGWKQLQEGSIEGLDDWSVRHIDALATLESAAVAAVEGNSLLHFDIRADNLLLTPSRVFVVDWPHACTGAPWVDLVAFAPSVAMQDGPDPEKLLGQHSAAKNADPNRITAALAAIAGYFTLNARLPPPPGIPTLRAFQAAQGLEARRWLAGRTGWE
jgi:aminoglycoside phosphotransferase (APT) family kinase protein